MDTTKIVEEVRRYVAEHGLEATTQRYAATLESWPGEPAGLWLRVSSGGQDEANHLPDVLGHCAEHGYRPAVWYVLHDKSASKGEQQDEQDKSVEDMREGIIGLSSAGTLTVWSAGGRKHCSDSCVESKMPRVGSNQPQNRYSAPKT